MTKEELDCFRDSLDVQLKETYKDIDVNISYIIIGALGFFLTMLDKFIDVKKATLIWLAFLSLCSLLVAFFKWLYNKHIITKLARQQLDFVDDKLSPNLDNIELEQELLKLWKDSDGKLREGRKLVYIFLGIGVFLQVAFFFYNILMNKTDEKQNEQKIKIEIIAKDSILSKYNFNTIIDTPKFNQLK
jgi:hypothetical protein